MTLKKLVCPCFPQANAEMTAIEGVAGVFWHDNPHIFQW